MMPKKVMVTDVGTRDGFQIEPVFIATEEKIRIVDGLIGAGLPRLEVTSFVSPKAVPQLRDAEAVLAGIHRRAGTQIACLVPNARGAERAAASQVDELVVVVSASESHNRANVNRGIAASLDGFGAVADIARAGRMAYRAAIAVAFGCPFEGEVPAAAVVQIAGRLLELGFAGINLGDTTGMATPAIIRKTVAALRQKFPAIELTLHLHNTRGLGLVNAMAGLELGIERFEASIAGLGGCPFAPGASGNICTEDLVFMLHESGIETGIDLDALIEVARETEALIGRALPGQVMKAGTRGQLHDLAVARRAVW